MSVYQLLLLLILIGLFAAALLLHLPPEPTGQQPGSPWNPPFGESVHRNDDQYWPGGIFYNNPDDPALFVPKRFGLGWTLNVGHTRGRLILIVALLLLIALAVVGVVSRGIVSG